MDDVSELPGRCLLVGQPAVSHYRGTQLDRLLQELSEGLGRGCQELYAGVLVRIPLVA